LPNSCFGGNIRITLEGKLLFNQCRKIFEIEKETKMIVSGSMARGELKLAVTEDLLMSFGIKLTKNFSAHYPELKFQFYPISAENTLSTVLSQGSDIGIVSNPKFRSKEFVYLSLGHSTFSTYVGEGHPLFNLGRSSKIQEVLNYDFVTPEPGVFNLGNKDSSNDGWRDDKFLRSVKYEGMGLSTLLALVEQGRAIGYLPDYVTAGRKLKKLQITGCPYTCESEVFAVFKKSLSRDWIRKVLN